MHPSSKQTRRCRRTRLSWPVSFLCLAAACAGPGFASPSNPTNERLSDLLELRSYTRIGGTLEFSVYNKEEKRSEWLSVGEQQRDYKIESYDPDTNTIVIRYRNRIGNLHLQASRIADYVPPAPAAKPENGSPRPSGQSVPANSETRAPRPAHEPPARLRDGPDFPESDRHNSRDRSEQAHNFLSRGSSPSQGTPSNPSPGEENPGSGGGSGGGGGGGENSSGFSWESLGSPPPLPPTAPPIYSPEE